MFSSPTDAASAAWIYKIAGVLFAIVSAIAVYIGKQLASLYKNLTHIATNCVPTIQKNTEETNRLLAEMNGYLKAKAEDGKI